jgi:hypothetical protein
MNFLIANHSFFRENNCSSIVLFRKKQIKINKLANEKKKKKIVLKQKKNITNATNLELLSIYDK